MKYLPLFIKFTIACLVFTSVTKVYGQVCSPGDTVCLGNQAAAIKQASDASCYQNGLVLYDGYSISKPDPNPGAYMGQALNAYTSEYNKLNSNPSTKAQAQQMRSFVTSCLGGKSDTDGCSVRTQFDKLDQQLSDACKDVRLGKEGNATVAAGNTDPNAQCLANAAKCKDDQATTDDTLDCSGMDIDNMKSTGASNASLASACEDMFPPACGGATAGGLLAEADQEDKDLAAKRTQLQDDQKTEQQDLINQQADIKHQQQLMQQIPIDYKKKFSDQADSFGAQLDDANKNAEQKVAPVLQAVAQHQADLTAKVQAVNQINLQQLDAQRAATNQCKSMAIACANSQKKPGNQGSTSSLIFSNAYIAKLQAQYFSACTGNLANATDACSQQPMSASTALASINNQLAQAQADLSAAQTTLTTDKANLKQAQSMVSSLKATAASSNAQKKLTADTDMLTQENKDLQSAKTDLDTLNSKYQLKQQELQKTMTALTNIPQKQACISTMRQCAKQAGQNKLNQDSKDNPPDVRTAIPIASKIITLCQNNQCLSNEPDCQTLPDSLKISKKLKPLPPRTTK